MPAKMTWNRHNLRVAGSNPAPATLAYLARGEFPPVVKPPETSRVWKQVTAEFPDNIHAIMNTTQWGWTENMTVVWDRPDRMPAWEACIRKYDVTEARISTPATASSQD